MSILLPSSIKANEKIPSRQAKPLTGWVLLCAFICLLLIHQSRFLEHIVDQYAVAFGRIVDEDMGDSTDDLAILNDRAAAHALNDAACALEQDRIGDFDDQAFAVVGSGHDFFDADLVGLHVLTV